MTDHVIIEVWKTPNGTYAALTTEMKRLHPEGEAMRIQKPTFEEAKQGIKQIELPLEEDTPDEQEDYDPGDLSGAELLSTSEPEPEPQPESEPDSEPKRKKNVKTSAIPTEVSNNDLG